MSYNFNIHFTIQEAKAALPDAIRLLKKIQELNKSLTSTGFDIYKHKTFGGSQVNGIASLPKEMQQLIDVYKEFSIKGYILKNVERGLLDFPSIRSNGEEVFLCYLLGEETISYWHGEEGFNGRKDLNEF
ncbi:MAG: DUF2203 domain-containing protein [Chlorobi bacterium]|jgi:hypothetical protein|nr:DUF2203 domain-containing protein [Chlorobiota bacterium]